MKLLSGYFNLITLACWIAGVSSRFGRWDYEYICDYSWNQNKDYCQNGGGSSDPTDGGKWITACNIYVTGAEGSQAWSNAYSLSKGYTRQGANQTPGSCYYSEARSRTYAYLDIPTNDVKQVRLLSYGSAEMYGTVVKVCKKGGACTQCGPSAAAVPTGQWAYFVCPYSVRGNQIKLSQDYSNLAFCEIDIACDEDVKFGSQIFPTGGTASPANGNNFRLESGYSKQGQNPTPDTCYYSESKNFPYAKLSIPSSLVRQVKLLSYDTREMNSVVVKVCTNGKSCKQCGGYSDDVPTKQWSVFECSKPLQGNEIQIEQGSYYFLAFCEVEIRGDPAPITTTTTTTSPTTSTTTTSSTTTSTTTTPEPTCPDFTRNTQQPVPIKRCDRIKPKNGDYDCQNAYDGSLSNKIKEGFCFVGQSSKQGWVEFYLSRTARVSKVALIPKGNGESIIGARIQVCNNDANHCQHYANINSIDKDWCTIVERAPKTGNMILISIEGSNLVVCEIKVFE